MIKRIFKIIRKNEAVEDYQTVVIPDFVKKTFEKYPSAEYCMDCGIFVVSAYEHTARRHIVVRRVL